MDDLRRLYRPPWRIDLTIRPGVAVPLAVSRLADAIAAAASAARASAPASVGLILAGDAELARLNRTVLGHRGPTDVLSFPLLAPDAFPDHPGRAGATDRPGATDWPVALARAGPSAPPSGPPFALPPGVRPSLGEIVVSVAQATRQAVAGRGGQDGHRRWTAADELRLLVTHGTLHLCGWDHADPVEGAAMRRLERTLLGLAEGEPASDGRP